MSVLDWQKQILRVNPSLFLFYRYFLRLYVNRQSISSNRNCIYKSKVATVSNTPQPYQCSSFLTTALHEGESHIPALPTSPRAQWTQGWVGTSEKISLHRPDIDLRFCGHPGCSPNQETKRYVQNSKYLGAKLVVHTVTTIPWRVIVHYSRTMTKSVAITPLQDTENSWFMTAPFTECHYINHNSAVTRLTEAMRY